jgi:hypothetical protein
MKDGQKLKLGDAHFTPKKYPRSTIIKAWASPSSSTKMSGHLSRHYIFIASYAMCCSWSVLMTHKYRGVS